MLPWLVGLGQMPLLCLRLKLDDAKFIDDLAFRESRVGRQRVGQTKWQSLAGFGLAVRVVPNLDAIHLVLPSNLNLITRVKTTSICVMGYHGNSHHPRLRATAINA